MTKQATAPSRSQTQTPRQRVEVAAPGMAVGLVAGLVAGGMTGFVGLPLSWAVTSAVTLAIPLALAGGTYGTLLAQGRVRIGGFAPAALFWLFAFPLARLAQEVLTRLVLSGQPGFPPDVLGFLAYQGLVSAGFAIGFLWLHERVAPRWWYKVAARNPGALEAFDRYAVYAEAITSRKRRTGRTGGGRR